MLILLYYLSQNPDFPESVRPLMGQLKNSEEMLKFINDLSRFSDLFSALRRPGEKGDGGNGGSAGAPGKTGAPGGTPPKDGPSAPEREKRGQKENPPSPTSGIADKFIEECLEKYFKGSSGK